MDKTVFKTEQPIVYRVLSNALKRDHLAHAYLFFGPEEADKEGTALLFAQSIICEHPDEDGFACQKCARCKALENRESLDFIFNQDNPIKKDSILDLQDQFSKTAYEEAGQKIYILSHFDTATSSASNSLLKFLEEPQPDITGILIAPSKNSVLPTIASRAQPIAFKPVDLKKRAKQYETFCSPREALFFAKGGYTLAEAEKMMEQESFKVIEEAALEYGKNMSSLSEIVKMQELLAAKSDMLTKENVRLFIEWLLDYINHEEILDGEKRSFAKLILVENYDLLRRPVDLALYLDKIYYQLRKAIL